jgi:hypothetical protein
MAQDNTLDPGMILAALEAKIAALQALVASWKAAAAIGALGPIGELPAGEGKSFGIGDIVDLPQGAFRNMSVPEAVKLYLSASKTKQTIKGIAVALKEGGLESTSDNFEGVVTGSLHRLKDRGEVLKFKDGWALAEHYPEALRQRLSQTTEKKKPGKRKGPKGKKAPTITPKSSQEAAATQVKGTQDSILSLLKSKPAVEFSANDVANQLKMRIQTAHFLLGKLVYHKQAEKTAAGTFKAA